MTRSPKSQSSPPMGRICGRRVR